MAAEVALALRFAAREMRAGLNGFLVFMALIAIGVAGIGAVGSVARSIADGVASEGRTLLGGDIRFSFVQREPTEAENAWLSAQGAISHSRTLRTMARRPDGADQTLVEIKAVDAAWPLLGTVGAEPAWDHAALDAGGRHGLYAQRILADRLSIAVGDRLRIGETEFTLAGILEREPDAASDGFGFAPRVIMSTEGLDAAGLVKPGSLYEHVVKIRLADGAPDAAVARVREAGDAEFPEAGWGVRSRDNAAPGLTNAIRQLSQFLTLVGLSALLVGGVGVANAVAAHLSGKRGVIATLKCLGAPRRLVFLTYLAQILMIALLGILAGLLVAAAAPFALASGLRTLLPFTVEPALQPVTLALAALYGLLITLAFATPALGRSSDVPATALFRELGLDSGRPGWRHLGLAGVFAGLLSGLAILMADNRGLALTFLSATLFAFIVLAGVGRALRWLAARAPRPEGTAMRLALGNIHRPGALTSSVVLSLGLGLTLIVTLSLIDGNFSRQVSDTLARQAPNFFFVDVRKADIDAFEALLKEQAPKAEIVRAPMIRGRIVMLNGIDADKIDAPGEARWVLRGDRGITYSSTLPENSRIADGAWWAADHAGDNLVSFAEEEGRALGLKLGDTVTINVLGRNVTARIANFRAVEWNSLGINFVMVFSPNTLAGAPHGFLATLADRTATAEDEARILKAVTAAWPAVTSVRVKDALEIVNRLVGQLAAAVRAASSVALVAAVLVLSGALAAGSRTRIRDAVILKTLGATRATLISAWSLEFALIGLATAIFSLAAGGIAAWYVTERIMQMQAFFSPAVAAIAVAVALVLTVGFGLIGTWRVLGHKAAPVLRNE